MVKVSKVEGVGRPDGTATPVRR